MRRLDDIIDRLRSVRAVAVGCVVIATLTLSTTSSAEPPDSSSSETADTSHSSETTDESSTSKSAETSSSQTSSDESAPSETAEPPSSAQPASPSADESSNRGDYFGNQHRHRLYRQSKLEYYKAALWTALLPGLGNFYVDQYFLGGLHLSLMGFTALFLSYGLATERMPAVWASVVTSGLAYTSGMTTSLLGVTAYNRRLRRSLQVSVHLRPGGPDSLQVLPAVRVGFRF